MSSPLGHALAGVIVAWSAERLPSKLRPITRASLPLLIAGAALAVLPDIDLIHVQTHRSYSHSLTAVLLVTILSAGVTRGGTGHVRWGTALVCGVAYASHLLLDWLGEDFNIPRGIQLFWPLSDQWFLSGWDIFRGTERARPLSPPSILHNIRTAAQEIATLAPFLLALWMTRARSR